MKEKKNNQQIEGRRVRKQEGRGEGNNNGRERRTR